MRRVVNFYSFQFKTLELRKTCQVMVPAQASLTCASFHRPFNRVSLLILSGFPGGSGVKSLPANAGDEGSFPGLGKSSGEGNGNPPQYSCLKKSHGQRSLAGYSPVGHKEPDIVEQLSTQR